VKLFFLFLSLIIEVPDWYNETDKIVQEIDSNSINIYEKEVITGDEKSKQVCYSYKTYFKTEVIISDSSTSSNFVLDYYSKKNKAFAYKLKMDVHYYTKGINDSNDSNRYYEETLIYFKSKDEGIELKKSFYYNDLISTDSLNNLNSTIEFKSRDVERKEIEKIIKNLKRMKYKCY